MTELYGEARRYMASYALFNQAVADHLRLHPTDVQCLNLLSLEERPVTTGRVAELTGLTTGSATRLVDRLERAGYVTRERDTEDRRRVLVALVPGRMAELATLWRKLNGTWGTMFDVYSDAEVATWRPSSRWSRPTAWACCIASPPRCSRATSTSCRPRSRRWDRR